MSFPTLCSTSPFMTIFFSHEFKKIPNIVRFNGKVVVIRNLQTLDDVICGGCDNGNLATITISYYCVVFMHEEKKNSIV